MHASLRLPVTRLVEWCGTIAVGLLATSPSRGVQLPTFPHRVYRGGTLIIQPENVVIVPIRERNNPTMET